MSVKLGLSPEKKKMGLLSERKGAGFKQTRVGRLSMLTDLPVAR
jgi:hypothetical protein